MEPINMPGGEHNPAFVFEKIKNVFQLDDTNGIELFSKLHRITRLTEMADSQWCGDLDLSGPRWWLMIRLLVAERSGETRGLTPTDLSHYQRVSKNSISSLLRGLEEQGLVERALDSTDLRVFRIKLSPAGRALILDAAPRRMAGLNKLASSLAPEERQQLSGLLDKLLVSLLVQVRQAQNEPDRP